MTIQKSTSTAILALLLFFGVACKQQTHQDSSTTTDTVTTTQTIETPKGFSILGQTEGDLDKDEIAEKVIVYDTEKEVEFGTERQVYIYKKKADQWTLWKKINGGILPSQHGGMMGDPFDNISIEHNCIVINHFGGSSEKWHYTHRFRYQNDAFQLIGATVKVGMPCATFTTLDYNLSNGHINYIEETENCDDNSTQTQQEKFVQKLELLPNIDGFTPGSNELQLADIIAFY